jgi:hypothetical protein
LAPRLGCCPNCPCKRTFGFAITPAMHRCHLRTFLWSGAPFWPTPVTRCRAPPPSARAPPPSRLRARLVVGSAVKGLDPPSPRVNPASNGQPGDFLLKRLPASFYSHAGPSTSIDPHRSVLKFRFKPLALLDFRTRGPEQHFYELNLLF